MLCTEFWWFSIVHQTVCTVPYFCDFQLYIRLYSVLNIGDFQLCIRLYSVLYIGDFQLYVRLYSVLYFGDFQLYIRLYSVLYFGDFQLCISCTFKKSLNIRKSKRWNRRNWWLSALKFIVYWSLAVRFLVLYIYNYRLSTIK